MDTTQWVITTGGIAAIIGIAIFFFTSQQGVAMEATMGQGTQEQRVVVKGGYSPNVIKLRAGTPARLVFERHETSGCSEELLIPEYGVQRHLPAHESTVVEFTPNETGTYEFTCGMHMLRGKIVVE
jgi:plastocyanin domain-containing protein